MGDLLSLANPAMTGIGPTMDRTARPANRNVPQGAVIVAADTHWEVCEDIFYDAFPEQLKDQAPRVWFDRFWHMGFRGAAEAVKADEEGVRVATQCLTQGLTDIEVRRSHLGIEGISKEIVYPQSLLFFVGHRDREIQERIWRTYNEYIASVGDSAPDSFFGVGVFSNWWDPDAAEGAMRQIVDLGLKTFMLPVFPKSADGKDLSYGDKSMDRFWSVVAEAKLPVSFHVTENFMPGTRGALGISIANASNHFRKPFTQLIFGGVFDRHPDLKVVFAEGGISWVLTALQDAEMVCDSFGDLVDPIAHRPTYYWQNNCYATFQNDLLGLRNLAYLGTDNIMWSNDYPHPEGAFGYSAESVQHVLDFTDPDQARAVLGGTAIKLYDL